MVVFQWVIFQRALLRAAAEVHSAAVCRLAADPGIVGVMRQHKWTVGLLRWGAAAIAVSAASTSQVLLASGPAPEMLRMHGHRALAHCCTPSSGGGGRTCSEMPPEGKVGVSPVCVLGVNINAGQEISLRLRTDDLRGEGGGGS